MAKQFLIAFLIIGLLVGGAFFWWQQQLSNWETDFSAIGTFSSPRTADLNADGVKDIIIGAGAAEFEATDTAVIALDGRDGSILWALGAKDQIVSNPVLLDINRDNTLDIVIGGRSGQLMAVNGKSGDLLWDFKSAQSLDFPLFNFYTPAIVEDYNGDEIPELLVAQGGDVSKKPHETDRPPGMLMLISGHDGQLITYDYMPDGKETYMSPVIYEKQGEKMILFGSGGETIPGHFYQLPLQLFVENGLSQAQILASGKEKGFIAPPLLHDLNRDGQEDILVNAVEGRLLFLDGSSHELIWDYSLDSMEVYTAAAVGHFNEDNIPDVFVNFGKGIWPDLVQCRQLALDGNDGSLLFEDSLSFFSMSSPVILDINGDGMDEALLSINYRPEKTMASGLSFSNEVFNKLVAFDIANGKQLRLDILMEGPNAAVTPYLDDLEDNGKLDLIFAYQTDAYHMGQFNGMRVLRKELDIPMERVRQAGYLLQPLPKK